MGNLLIFRSSGKTFQRNDAEQFWRYSTLFEGIFGRYISEKKWPSKKIYVESFLNKINSLGWEIKEIAVYCSKQ